MVRENFSKAVQWLGIDEHGVDGGKLRGHDYVQSGVSWGKAQQFGLTWEEFTELTPGQAEQLLLGKVWVPTGCDELAAGLDYAVFDAVYRLGPLAVGKLLAGLDGPPVRVIQGLSNLQLRRYRSMPGHAELYLPRLNRIVRVRRRALKLAGCVVLVHDTVGSGATGG